MGYDYADYGPDPYPDTDVNADHGWGGYCWPAGVPADLLTTFHVDNAGGTSTLTFRSELVELVELSCQFGPLYGYPIRAYVDGEYWGPWSYQNRAISGTSTPSNHSKGKAWDINAPNNPYTSPLVCDMPPPFVWAMEAVGWCWGGRYTGDKDAMHYEYGFSPADVAGHVAIARGILAGGDYHPEGEDDVTEDDINKIADRVWSRLITTKTGECAPVEAGEVLAYIDQHTQTGPLADQVAEKVWQYLLESRVVTIDDAGTPAMIGVGDLLTYVDLHTQP